MLCFICNNPTNIEISQCPKCQVIVCENCDRFDICRICKRSDIYGSDPRCPECASVVCDQCYIPVCSYCEKQVTNRQYRCGFCKLWLCKECTEQSDKNFITCNTCNCTHCYTDGRYCDYTCKMKPTTGACCPDCGF